MTIFFEKPGEENTAAAIGEALRAARERGLRHVVVASCSGRTARELFARGAPGLAIVCVTHHVGFAGPGVDEMGEEVRAELAGKGVRVLTTTHALAGVDRALRVQFGGISPPEILAGALRMFGQGVKVCVEIAIMALDAGLVPHGADVVAIGGTGKGADAACVVRPAHSNAVLDTRVVEILCRPRV
jgi:uncharacterized protein